MAGLIGCAEALTCVFPHAAFIFAGTLSLYEHQSTVNKNMPVRFLLYLAEEYQKVIERAEISLHGSRRIPLPVSKCVVFYNGDIRFDRR